MEDDYLIWAFDDDEDPIKQASEMMYRFSVSARACARAAQDVEESAKRLLDALEDGESNER